MVCARNARSDLKIFSCKIPLAAKVAGTAFLAVLVPVYLHTYGPTNFLWFCDAALILTVAGMWLESSLLISMCAVGILLPQCVWLADFGGHLLGFHLLGLTGYMFDHQLPLFTRGLSLFHGWLPILLVWLLFRLGYDRRALTVLDRPGRRVGARLLFFYSACRCTSGQSQHSHQSQLHLRLQRSASATVGQPKPLCRPVTRRAVAGCLSPHPSGLAQNLQRATTGSQS